MRVTAAVFDSRIGGFVRLELATTFHKDEGASLEIFPIPFSLKEEFGVGATYTMRLERIKR